MTHLNQLSEAFAHEWENGTRHHALPQDAKLQNDGTRYWWVKAPNHRHVISWECRNFPGCASLIITTKVELSEDLRGRGLGRHFRELRHRAYKRAGFVGEIATVRTDNDTQNHLMQTMGATRMGDFPSDYGGQYALWLTKLSTNLLAQPIQRNPHERLGIMARVHEADWTGHVLENATHAQLDAIAMQPNVVQPLPGDVPGFRRQETDNALCQRVLAVLPGRRPKKFAHRGTI